jgi:hypothetical protein
MDAKSSARGARSDGGRGIDECFRPIRDWHAELTGVPNFRQNAITHRRLSLFWQSVPGLWQAAAFSTAKMCATCGATV